MLALRILRTSGFAKNVKMGEARQAILISSMNSSNLSYSEKQALKGRPVSPHVTIYKFPMGAITSITNRFTGMSLTAGLAGIATITLLGGDPAALMIAVGASSVGPVAKGVVSFPLVYHYLGGVRHVIWDRFPEATLNNKAVEQSSYLLFGASGLTSLLLAFLTI